MIKLKLPRMKKGQGMYAISTKMIYFMVVAFTLTIIFMLYIFFLAKVNSQYVPDGLRKTVHTHRFLNTCFSYVDPETGRTFSGVIDESVFTEQRFKECYLVDQNSRYAYRLELVKGDKKTVIASSNFRLTRPFDNVGKPVIVESDGVQSYGVLNIGSQVKG